MIPQVILLLVKAYIFQILVTNRSIIHKEISLFSEDNNRMSNAFVTKTFHYETFNNTYTFHIY